MRLDRDLIARGFRIVFRAGFVVALLAAAALLMSPSDWQLQALLIYDAAFAVSSIAWLVLLGTGGRRGSEDVMALLVGLGFWVLNALI